MSCFHWVYIISRNASYDINLLDVFSLFLWIFSIRFSKCVLQCLPLTEPLQLGYGKHCLFGERFPDPYWAEAGITSLVNTFLLPTGLKWTRTTDLTLIRRAL